MKRECVGCGRVFDTSDTRRQRCKKNCSRQQTSKTRNGARHDRAVKHDVTFIGVDGEGVTVNGKHYYVLLSVGNKSLHKHGEELQWNEIFEFLWKQFQDAPANAVFVGFFLGYDFTQWFKTLPEDRAYSLLHREGIVKRRRRLSGGNTIPFPVRTKEWEFDILGVRRFKLRKRGHGKQWMYVCDAGPFFQTSLLSAINPKKWMTPVCTDDEYRVIEEGKRHRATARFDPKMVTYNVTENRVLSRLMNVLNDGFVQAGIRLNKNQWFGPGQAAQEWMHSIGAPTTYDVLDVTPEWALEALQGSYYGGWFEIFAHGPIPGAAYEYDINSAYPYALSTLPCLLHGTWERGDDSNPVPSEYLLVHAEVRSPKRAKVGAMPHRDRDGGICRPLRTSGWYWWTELEAARRAGTVRSIVVDRWVRYTPCACDPPFGAIVDLYQWRLSVGKNSSAGKSAKLMYNSAYGKTAQSIGDPKFASAFYASRITATCRTMILDAIATHPTKAKDLLMVATDGVYFRTPHPHLDISEEELGRWDTSQKMNMSLFMPGVYWDDKTRERLRRGEAPNLKSRGISASDLAAMVESIDEAWLEWMRKDLAEVLDQDWPSITVPVKFSMVSATQALAWGRWERAGEVTQGQKIISADPSSKRTGGRVLDGVIVSDPYPVAAEVESVPYRETFGAPEQDELYMYTPDGELNAILAQALTIDEE